MLDRIIGRCPLTRVAHSECDSRGKKNGHRGHDRSSTHGHLRLNCRTGSGAAKGAAGAPKAGVPDLGWTNPTGAYGGIGDTMAPNDSASRNQSDGQSIDP